MDTGYPALITEPLATPNNTKKIQQSCCTAAPEENPSRQGNADQTEAETVLPSVE